MDIDRRGWSAFMKQESISQTRPGYGSSISLAFRRAAFLNGSRRIWRPLAQRRTLMIMILVNMLILTGLFMHLRAMQQPPQPMPIPYAFIPSPNCDDRPADAIINCIVLHSTVEPTTEGTMKIFLTPERRVSAHFIVGRDGRVVQMVPVEKRAWHAGLSVLDNVPSVNNFSVGIEMVNLNDGSDPYTPEQMEAVAGIIRLIRSRYDVPDSRIVSHAQVALPPGRKSDPVGFDFDKIRTLARVLPPTDPRPVLAAPPAPPAPGGKN
jgi:N-acetylmuramoyl-L-alanine amidase